MAEFLDRGRALSAAQLAPIMPFLEERNVRLAVIRFIAQRRSAQIVNLLRIPALDAELWRDGLFTALNALDADDPAAFRTVIWHQSAPSGSISGSPSSPTTRS
jgi:hypothetical protein